MDHMICPKLDHCG